MRVFVDANILFSAAYTPQGRTADFIETASDYGFELVTSDYAVAEALGNLRCKKPEAIADFCALLPHLHVVMWSAPEPNPVVLREKDRPILAAAIEARCKILVTGDRRDFGPYLDQPARTGGVRILTLAGLLEAK